MEIGGGLWGLLRNSPAAAQAVCPGMAGAMLSSLGRSHCLELQLHLALEPGRGWAVRQKGLCGGVSCQ